MTTKTVYIVDGTRTPFLKAKGRPGPFSASDLAFQTGRTLLSRMPFSPEELDEVILGCMIPGPNEANIGRLVALRLGCGWKVPGWTVQRNCASGMQALDCGFQNIITGRSNLVLAGGTEAMSHSPLLHNRLMVEWFADWARAKGGGTKFRLLKKLRPAHLKPVIALLCGLTDPLVALSMGQTAEIIAHRFGLTRKEIDLYSAESHKRLALAQDKNFLEEVEGIYDTKGKFYDQDEGLRRDTTAEGLSKLRPVFDRDVGKVTAGNSAQVTDGAALLILASEDAVAKHKLPVLGRIVGCSWAGLNPSEMGLGSAHSVVSLLKEHNLTNKDIDYWELNEAFSAQVLSCLKAWKDPDYCSSELNLETTFGVIDPDKLNVDGGGVSLGHPVGASGARIVLHLLHVLRRNNAKRGVATLCIGGGQGGAMLVEVGEA